MNKPNFKLIEVLNFKDVEKLNNIGRGSWTIVMGCKNCLKEFEKLPKNMRDKIITKEISEDQCLCKEINMPKLYSISVEKAVKTMIEEFKLDIDNKDFFNHGNDILVAFVEELNDNDENVEYINAEGDCENCAQKYSCEDSDFYGKDEYEPEFEDEHDMGEFIGANVHVNGRDVKVAISADEVEGILDLFKNVLTQFKTKDKTFYEHELLQILLTNVIEDEDDDLIGE